VRRIVWTEPAKSDVRSLGKPVAMQVFSALLRLQNRAWVMLRRSKAEKNYDCASATTASYLSVRTLTRLKFAASVIAVRPTAEAENLD